MMAALEYLTNNKPGDVPENRTSAVRLSVASFLSGIPEPAAQTAAIQLLKSKFALDRSFALCIGLIGLAVMEEMV